MITRKELEDMSKLDIDELDRNKLKDITAIQIRHDLPHDEKVLAFLSEIKNPYCFRCGETPVKICFSDNGPKLAAALEAYFIHLKEG